VSAPPGWAVAEFLQGIHHTGPRLGALELRTYRFRAHSMFDPELYREKSEVARWMERDPILLLKAALETAGQLPEEQWAALQADVDAEVGAGVGFAEAGTLEPVEDLTRFVYSERSGDAEEGQAAG
jgi:pyruvate dehydrogenase E1 component alpha subunit